MGCRGVIRILLEPINQHSILLNFLRLSIEDRNRQVIGTLVAADSPQRINIGGRIFYNAHDEFQLDNLPIFLANLPELRNDCLKRWREENDYGLQTYKIEQGNFEFSLELVKPPISLCIFGAGADAIPLAEIAAQIGWQVTIADHRPAFLTGERFPQAKNLILNNSEDFSEKIVVDNQTVAVVMSHNYERDREILSALLKSEAFYVGALGPKQRTEKLLQELKDGGENFTDAQLKRLYAPVGLDIGADTPEAIALSIVAEIQTVLKNRAGGFLRQRKGAIYKDDADEQAKDKFDNFSRGRFEPSERRAETVA